MTGDDPTDEVFRTEYFGPILAVHVYDDHRYDDILELVDRSSDYALTGAVFADDRAAIAAAHRTLRNAAGNFYVNDKPTGSIVSRQPFGGGALPVRTTRPGRCSTCCAGAARAPSRRRPWPRSATPTPTWTERHPTVLTRTRKEVIDVPDVVIIGGGCIGSAAALHLLKDRPGISVTVVEPDPTYSAAATPHATGGVRQLFTRPENIELSRYTLQVIADWPAYVGLGDAAPDLAWKENGYLFVAPPDQTAVLEKNYTTQAELGVEAEWLDAEDLRVRYPFLRTDDLGPAVLSPRDGWLDPHSLLQGLRRGAQQLGADYLVDRVAGLEKQGTRVVSVSLASGTVLRPDWIIDAAGIAAPGLAAQVGMSVPVEPMPRQEHFVEAEGDYTAMPFIKDPYGLAVRSEGAGLSVGLVDFDTPASLELPRNTDWFDHHVWPALADRIPSLDALRLKSTWAGHYDQNRLDGNMIIGNRPGVVDNFLVACGFSGHGLMHAPGVGRALAELIVDGGYRTIELSRFGYRRIEQEEPYRELGVR